MAGKKKHPKKQPTKIDWAKARDDFIAQNLDPTRERPYTLRDVARSWGVSYSQVRHHASKEDWYEALREQAQLRSEEAIERTRSVYAEMEAELRERQANLGRLAQEVGEGRLLELLDSKGPRLNNRDAMDLVFRGGEMERKARGIPDRVDVRAQDVVGDDTDQYESPDFKIARQRERRRLKERLAEVMSGRAGGGGS